jgi:hypothetical protein
MMSGAKKAVGMFRTSVPGIGPYCVEFEDGEIISTRSEARQKAIAGMEQLQEERDALLATTLQPIATAPKDKTEILLFEVDSDGKIQRAEAGLWEFIETSDWDGMPIYDWATSYGMIEDPTHWMPLPKVERAESH